MANKSYIPVDTLGRLTGAPLTWAIDTTGVINLGDASEPTVSSRLLQIRANGAVFSLVLRQKLHASGVADASAPTTVYSRPNIGAAEIIAGTAITGDALAKVICDGTDVIMDVTMTSGTLLVETSPVYG